MVQTRGTLPAAYSGMKQSVAKTPMFKAPKPPSRPPARPSKGGKGGSGRCK